MQQLRSGKLLQLVIIFAAMAICGARAQSPRRNSLSLATQDRLEDEGWWPTKGNASRSEYVDAATCKECHGKVAALQETTPMRHAGVRAAQADILQKHEQLSFQDAAYRYSLVHAGSDITFSASDGANSASGNVTWAFGAGELGQTYLLQKEGAYTESRLSYYSALSALDITIGQAADPPAALKKALGHNLNQDSVRHCFSCHTTAAITSGAFDPEKSTPGLTCEACHGPGARHVAAMMAQQFDQASSTIVNPRDLSPADSVDFCGACHRTWSDVAMQMPANIGLVSVRFQPYRLEKSRCWGKRGDSRITCVACHDPHQPLVRESSTYDPKCLACHLLKGQSSRRGAGAPACGVSTSNCTSCHMPKYEVPQSHARFTDHYIRVVRTGAAFPS
jgi:Cytochrome c3